MLIEGGPGRCQRREVAGGMYNYVQSYLTNTLQRLDDRSDTVGGVNHPIHTFQTYSLICHFIYTVPLIALLTPLDRYHHWEGEGEREGEGKREGEGEREGGKEGGRESIKLECG